MASKNRKPHYAWIIMAVGILLFFIIQALTNQIMGLFTIPISTEFGVPRSVFLLQNVAASVAGVITSPIWGKLFKKYGVRKLLALCVFMTAVGTLMRALSPNIIFVIIAGGIRGIFFAGTTALPVAILFTSWFEEKRGLAMSLTAIAASLGGAVFNPSAQWGISTFGWRWVDIACAVIIVLLVPVVLLLVCSDPSEKGLEPYGHNRTPADMSSPREKCEASEGLTFKEARSSLSFYLLLFAVLAVTMAGGAVTQVAAYLSDIGYDPTVAANMVSIVTLLSLGGRYLMGVVQDKFKPITANLTFFVVGAAGYFGIGLAANFGGGVLWCGFVMYAFFSGIHLIMPPLWTSACFGNRDYATIWGWVVSSSRLGGVLGSYLTGVAYDVLGSMQPMWMLIGGLMLISMLAILYCYRHAARTSGSVA